ncbi:MAG: hypothetical protein RBS56_05265 [Candidatus Gracilibacteria bacterium]|nr:hypothetical protein [Candidatus Gracilibacteria bacterium]
MEKVVDAIKNPDEAFKWLKTAVISSLAGSWLGDIFGISDAMKKAKEKVMEVISNPMNILLGLLGGFAGFKALKGIASLLKAPTAGSFGLIKKTFSGLRMATGAGLKLAALGTMGYAAIKLYEYFTDNEDEASSMPQDKASQRAWWKEKIEKSGLKDELKEEEIVPLMALVMGEERAETMFKDLMEEDKKIEETEEKKKKESGEQIDEKGRFIDDTNYGIMRPIDVVTKDITKAISTKLSILKNTLQKYDDTLLLGAIGLQSVVDLKDVLFKTSVFTVDTLAKLAALPLRTMGLALGYPVSTLFTTLLFLELLKKSENIFIPEDPEKFSIFMKDLIEDKTDWLSETFGEKKAEIEETVAKSKNTLLENGLRITEKKMDKIGLVILKAKEYAESFLNDLWQSIEDLAKKGIEAAAITQEEYIDEVNIENLETFYHDLMSNSDRSKMEPLINELIEFKEYYKEEGKIDTISYEKLKKIGLLCGLLIEIDEGYYEWSYCDENAISDGKVHQFMVDIETGSKDEQYEKAKHLVYTNSISGGIEKFTENFKLEVRERIQGLNEILENDNGVIVVVKGIAYLIKGAGEKVLLGPADFVWDLLGQTIDKFKGEEFNYTELFISYGEGMLPVAVYELTKGAGKGLNSFRKNGFKAFKGIGKGVFDIVAQTATFKVKPIYKAGKFVLSYGAYALTLKFDRTSILDKLILDKETAFNTIKTKIQKIQLIKAKALEYIPGKFKNRYGKQVILLEELMQTQKLKLIFLEIKITPSPTDIKRLFEEAKVLKLDDSLRSQIQLDKYFDPKTNTLDTNTLRNDTSKIVSEIDIKMSEIKKQIKETDFYIEKTHLELAKKHIEKAKSHPKDSKERDNFIRNAEKELDLAGERGKRIQRKNLRDDLDAYILELEDAIKVATPEEVKAHPTMGAGLLDPAKQIKLDERMKQYESLPLNEKIDAIRTTDGTIFEINMDLQEKKTKLKRDASMKGNASSGNALTKKQLKAKLKNLDIEYDERIRNLYIERARMTEKIPIETIKKEKLFLDAELIERTKIEAPGEIVKRYALQESITGEKVKFSERFVKFGKRHYKSAAVFALMLLATYLAFKGSDEDEEIDEKYFESAAASLDNGDEENTNIDFGTPGKTSIFAIPTIEEAPKKARPLIEDETEREGSNPTTLAEISEDPSEMIETFSEMKDLFQSYGSSYMELMDTISDYNKIRKLKDSWLEGYIPKNAAGNLARMYMPAFEYVEQLSGKTDYLDSVLLPTLASHEQNLADIKRIMLSNRKILTALFENLPEDQQNKCIYIGPFIKIKYDKTKKEAYLSYPTSEELSTYSYMVAEKMDSWGEYMKKHIGETGWTSYLPDVIEMIKGSMPFSGSILQIINGAKENMRGNSSSAAKDITWGILSLELDIAGLGVTSFGKAGVKITASAASKLAQIGTKTAKIIENLGTKAMIGGMVFDATPEILIAFGLIDGKTWDNNFYATSPDKAEKITGPVPSYYGTQEEIPTERQKAIEYITNIIESIRDNLILNRIQYEIIDEKNIVLKRDGSNEQTKIKRSDDGTWNLEGTLAANGGYDTLHQAILMGNLSNQTMEWLENGVYTELKTDAPIVGGINAGSIELDAANENPFYISSGGDIEFDQNWSPIAVDYFDSESKMLKIYTESFKIPKDWIVNLLNRTYKKYLQKHSITRKFVELQEKFNNHNKGHYQAQHNSQKR